jgi:hypothetical protein
MAAAARGADLCQCGSQQPHQIAVLKPVRQSGGRRRPDPRPDPDHHPHLVPPRNSRPALPNALPRRQGPRLPGRRRVSRRHGIRAESRHWAATCQGPRPCCAPRSGCPLFLDRATPKTPSGRFVMVGTLEPRKNHTVILSAWAASGRRAAPDAMPRSTSSASPGGAGRRSSRLHPQPSAVRQDDIHSISQHRMMRSRDAFAMADTLLYPIACRRLWPAPL